MPRDILDPGRRSKAEQKRLDRTQPFIGIRGIRIDVAEFITRTEYDARLAAGTLRPTQFYAIDESS